MSCDVLVPVAICVCTVAYAGFPNAVVEFEPRRCEDGGVDGEAPKAPRELGCSVHKGVPSPLGGVRQGTYPVTHPQIFLNFALQMACFGNVHDCYF